MINATGVGQLDFKTMVQAMESPTGGVSRKLNEHAA